MTLQLRDRLRSDLTLAMKERDTTRVRVIRSTLSAIENAEAVAPQSHTEATIGYGDVARQSLSEEQILDVLRGEIEELESSAAGYEQVERVDAAETLHGRSKSYGPISDPSRRPPATVV